jgi:hypothetical protein
LPYMATLSPQRRLWGHLRMALKGGRAWKGRGMNRLW